MNDLQTDVDPLSMSTEFPRFSGLQLAREPNGAITFSRAAMEHFCRALGRSPDTLSEDDLSALITALYLWHRAVAGGDPHPVVESLLPQASTASLFPSDTSGSEISGSGTTVAGNREPIPSCNPLDPWSGDSRSLKIFLSIAIKEGSSRTILELLLSSSVRQLLVSAFARRTNHFLPLALGQDRASSAPSHTC